MTRRHWLVIAGIVALAIAALFVASALSPAMRFIYGVMPVSRDEAVLLTRRNEDDATYLWVQLVRADGVVAWSSEVSSMSVEEALGFTGVAGRGRRAQRETARGALARAGRAPYTVSMGDDARRIAVIGNAAGGKSTLARALAAARGLPLCEVDALQWGPSWELVPEATVAAALDRVQAGARWVIDGFGPGPCIEARMAMADMIVFVDLPLWVHYWWASERQHAMRIGVARPFGEREAPPTSALFETMWRVHEELRPIVRRLIDREIGRASVHHLTDVAALEAFCRAQGIAPPAPPPAEPSQALRLCPEVIVAELGLTPHPEGGAFVETWRDRAGTAIYFLLRRGEVSHWHRIDMAEVWHFYAGAALELTLAAPGARALEHHLLGRDLLAGQRPQRVVPPGVWQSARTLGDWTLVGCTVSPPFEFARFELAPPGWSPLGDTR